ncbi:MAG TPA: lipoprotein [Desulfomonilaceae bacterium]|nr:lipoprotein [Desulfomonilaceae bacterium]
MKKWLAVLLTILMLSGCSFSKVWKWIDEMDWERDDQTVRIVDFFMR